MKKKHQPVLKYINDKLKEGLTKLRLSIDDESFVDELEKRGWSVSHPYIIHRTHKKKDMTNKKISKKQKVLMYFQNGGGLSLHDSLKMFGLSALAQRVKELRQEGHDIVTQTRKGRGHDTYGFYFLKEFEHLHKYEA